MKSLIAFCITAALTAGTLQACPPNANIVQRSRTVQRTVVQAPAVTTQQTIVTQIPQAITMVPAIVQAPMIQQQIVTAPAPTVQAEVMNDEIFTQTQPQFAVQAPTVMYSQLPTTVLLSTGTPDVLASTTTTRRGGLFSGLFQRSSVNSTTVTRTRQRIF